MKLAYLTAIAITSLLAAGSVSIANVQVAQANPCAASQVNPCAAVDPCAAANPCAAKDPCAAASSYAAKDPCAAANPCAAKDPCAGAGVSKVVLKTSSFQPSAKQVSGNLTIVEKGGKRYVELDDSFASSNGPDLFLLLHQDAQPSRYNANNFVNLGRLQSVNGKQIYEIPDNVSIEDFRSAVIWCREFNVTFGQAVL